MAYAEAPHVLTRRAQALDPRGTTAKGYCRLARKREGGLRGSLAQGEHTTSLVSSSLCRTLLRTIKGLPNGSIPASPRSAVRCADIPGEPAVLARLRGPHRNRGRRDALRALTGDEQRCEGSPANDA